MKHPKTWGRQIFVVNLSKPSFLFLALCWCCWNGEWVVCVCRGVGMWWHIWDEHDLVTTFGQEYSSWVYLQHFVFPLAAPTSHPQSLIRLLPPSFPPPCNFNTGEYCILVYVLYVGMSFFYKKYNLLFLSLGGDIVSDETKCSSWNRNNDVSLVLAALK